MADTLEIFGTEYTNVAGIIATDDNGNDLTYTRGARVTQDQDGYIVLPKTGGGGGGGSSDFSTATVTLFLSGTAGIFLPEAYDYDSPVGDVTNALNIVYSTGSYQSGETHKVVLYKGKLILFKDNQYYADTVSVTGNAIYDPIEGMIVISGDCTITISE